MEASHYGAAEKQINPICSRRCMILILVVTETTATATATATATNHGDQPTKRVRARASTSARWLAVGDIGIVEVGRVESMNRSSA